ncbi:MAG: cytidylate kinase-like family protein [Muribaculaceae bacterium]|nr:cytidylate kinase-like family protein [Muribaculaceae bacterium]MDE7386336.1 cytidylate kinase-like family protein [Muribaculaceae bacterium]
MDESDKYVITVGRQFGSGGRLIGQAIADELGIQYYDKALLVEAAKHAGINPELFERKDEKAPSFFSGLLPVNVGYSSSYSLYPGTSSISDDAIYRAQSDVIRSLADRSSCVIVGRSADYALRDRDNVINIFVHAPIESRIKRIMERGDAATPEQARQLAERTNKLRAAYYNFYTDKRWGHASSYDLTIDSSLLDTPDIVALVKQYVAARTRNK